MPHCPCITLRLSVRALICDAVFAHPPLFGLPPSAVYMCITLCSIPLPRMCRRGNWPAASNADRESHGKFFKSVACDPPPRPPRKNLLAHFRCLTAHSSPLSYLIPSHFLLISSHLYMSLHLSSLLSGPLSFPAHLISFHLSCHVILPITSLRCHRSSSLTAQLAPCSGWLKPGGTFVFNLGKGEEDGEGPASVSHG